MHQNEFGTWLQSCETVSMAGYNEEANTKAVWTQITSRRTASRGRMRGAGQDGRQPTTDKRHLNETLLHINYILSTRTRARPLHSTSLYGVQLSCTIITFAVASRLSLYPIETFLFNYRSFWFYLGNSYGLLRTLTLIDRNCCDRTNRTNVKIIVETIYINNINIYWSF